MGYSFLLRLNIIVIFLSGIRTPLHAILGLLNPEDPGVPAPVVGSSPTLATALYKLIYTLVSTPDTSEPTLR